MVSQVWHNECGVPRLAEKKYFKATLQKYKKIFHSWDRVFYIFLLFLLSFKMPYSEIKTMPESVP